MRSQYHTLPYIGFDPFDTHFEYVTAKRHNIFKPEMMMFDYTQFKLDRMRLSQVRHFLFFDFNVLLNLYEF